jgi:hypothetical protein
MKKTTMEEWLGDAQQRLMTNLVNRSCKMKPTMLDRLAMRLLKHKIGEVPDDPELQHPE